MGSELTREEKSLVCQIAMDEETGNNLLRSRSAEYCEMCRRIYSMLDDFDTTPRSSADTELLEWYRAVKDPEEMERYRVKYETPCAV